MVSKYIWCFGGEKRYQEKNKRAIFIYLARAQLFSWLLTFQLQIMPAMQMKDNPYPDWDQSK